MLYTKAQLRSMRTCPTMARRAGHYMAQEERSHLRVSSYRSSDLYMMALTKV
jgi:hypothetical protein